MTSSFVNDVLPGMVAGFSQTVVGHPFDSVKVKYINNSSKTLLQCIKNMYMDNGIKSFYQGIKSPLYGGLFYNTTVFYSYNLFHKFLKKENPNWGVFENAFVTGSLIGITTTVIEAPMDMIKIQMQLDKSLSFGGALKMPIHQMYRGSMITMIRNIPSMGLYFGVFEHTQTFFTSQKLLGSLISGALSGCLCWGVTYPLDNIKTRIQSDPKKLKYKNAMDCFRKTKFRRMWSGFVPCMIRAVPVNASLFFGYTYVKETFKHN